MYFTTYFVFVLGNVLTWKYIVTENSVKQNLFSKVSICFDPSTSSSTSYKVTSDKDCALWCLLTEGCQSYSVETATHMCYLNDSLLDDTGCVNGFTHYNSQKAMDTPCLNEGMYNETTNTCRCFNSYVGTRCERLMQDCSDGFASGHYNDMKNTFTIHPLTSPSPFRVYCVMKWGGRTTILHQNTYKPYVNFTRDWNDYKVGFGNVVDNNNNYIGNDAIHFITSNRNQDMLFAVSFGVFYRQCGYERIQVASEDEDYRLTYKTKWIHETHPLGHCFLGNNISFSTTDRDNDADPGSCALTHMSGWWFDDCGPCNPTGQLQAQSETHQNGDPTSLHVVTNESLAVRNIDIYLIHKP